MDSVIVVAIIGCASTVLGSGIAGWLGARTQLTKWRDAEQKRTEREGDKAGAEATKSYAEASRSMADLANNMTGELTEMASRLADTNTRLAKVEDDNRAKGQQIAVLLTEKEEFTRIRNDLEKKILEQEDRIISLAQTVGTWQMNHHRLQMEFDDMRIWAEELVNQVLALGGTPAKFKRSANPGVIV